MDQGESPQNSHHLWHQTVRYSWHWNSEKVLPKHSAIGCIGTRWKIVENRIHPEPCQSAYHSCRPSIWPTTCWKNCLEACITEQGGGKRQVSLSWYLSQPTSELASTWPTSHRCASQTVVGASVPFSHNHFECQVWHKHRIPTLKDHPKHIRKDLRTLNNGFIQVCY